MTSDNDLAIQDFIDDTHRESIEYIKYIRTRVSYIRKTLINVWDIKSFNK